MRTTVARSRYDQGSPWPPHHITPRRTSSPAPICKHVHADAGHRRSRLAHNLGAAEHADADLRALQGARIRRILPLPATTDRPATIRTRARWTPPPCATATSPRAPTVASRWASRCAAVLHHGRRSAKRSRSRATWAYPDLPLPRGMSEHVSTRIATLQRFDLLSDETMRTATCSPISRSDRRRRRAVDHAFHYRHADPSRPTDRDRAPARIVCTVSASTSSAARAPICSRMRTPLAATLKSER